MGLTNAPAIFMSTMNNLFSDTLDLGVAVFLDNILVYSCTMKEYFTIPEKVLACLHQYTFYYKLKKCSLLCNSTIFLSFDVTLEGMHISDSKEWSLNKWPGPSTVK